MLGEPSANNDENVAVGGIVRRLMLILYDRRRLFFAVKDRAHSFCRYPVIANATLNRDRSSVGLSSLFLSASILKDPRYPRLTPRSAGLLAIGGLECAHQDYGAFSPANHVVGIKCTSLALDYI